MLSKVKFEWMMHPCRIILAIKILVIRFLLIKNEIIEVLWTKVKFVLAIHHDSTCLLYCIPETVLNGCYNVFSLFLIEYTCLKYLINLLYLIFHSLILCKIFFSLVSILNDHTVLIFGFIIFENMYMYWFLKNSC